MQANRNRNCTAIPAASTRFASRRVSVSKSSYRYLPFNRKWKNCPRSRHDCCNLWFMDGDDGAGALTWQGARVPGCTAIIDGAIPKMTFYFIIVGVFCSASNKHIKHDAATIFRRVFASSLCCILCEQTAKIVYKHLRAPRARCKLRIVVCLGLRDYYVSASVVAERGPGPLLVMNVDEIIKMRQSISWQKSLCP